MIPQTLYGWCRSSGAWFLSLSLLLAGQSVAQPRPRAQGQVYVWGFQTGCRPSQDLTRRTVDRLAQAGVPISNLLDNRLQPLPACPGMVLDAPAGCADLVRRSCGSIVGYVVGGVVAQNERATRMRVWLLDPQTQRLAVQDDYCQQCGSDLAGVLASQVSALLQNPPWDRSVQPKPSYCLAPQPPKRSESGNLYIGVFGHTTGRLGLRQQLLDRVALRRQSQNLPAPMVTDVEEPDRATFENLTGNKPGTQVLRVVMGSTIHLSLWDLSSQQVVTGTVTCSPQAGCTDPLELLAQRTSELLDVCFATRCAGLQSADQQPAEACTAFGSEVCAQIPVGLSTAHRMDDRLAKQVQVLTGLGVGLSTLTAAGLWIADGSLTLERGNTSFSHPLSVPAGVVSGLTVGLLGLSIPLWYLTHQAPRLPRSQETVPHALRQPHAIRCPM